MKLSLLFIPVGLLVLSSCVSSQKYSQAIQEKNKFKDQASMNESTIKLLQHRNDSLINQLAMVRKVDKTRIMTEDSQLNKDKATLDELKNAIKMEENRVEGIRQELCDALKCFTPDEISVKEREGELYVSMYDKLLFPSGKADVEKRGKEALKILSDVLNNNDMKIMVEGHTDPVPIHNAMYTDNWDLSVKRATNVVRVLTKDYHLKPERITASGKSKFDPIYDNKTAEGRKLNRRTDIVLVPKLEQLYSLLNQEDNLNLTKGAGLKLPAH